MRGRNANKGKPTETIRVNITLDKNENITVRSAAEDRSRWKEVFSQEMVANDQTRYAEKKKKKIDVDAKMSPSDK